MPEREKARKRSGCPDILRYYYFSQVREMLRAELDSILLYVELDNPILFLHLSSKAVVVKCELVIEKGHPELNQRVCVSKDESVSH